MSSLDTVMHCSTTALVVAILDVFKPDAESILDTTYGSGCFWRHPARNHVPTRYADRVTGSDLDSERAKDVCADYTALPFRDRSFDVVCFDPPHLSDSGAGSIMLKRYGTLKSGDDLRASIQAGLIEARRVARSLVIAKLANYTHANRPYRLTRWAEDVLGDAFEIILERPATTGADPKWRAQRTPRCRDSRFLVWRL